MILDVILYRQDQLFMEDKVVVQKIKKEYGTKMEIALKYYHIISIVNSLGLTDRQIELLAHTAVRGNISSATSKEEFIRTTGSSKPTINNMISKLAKSHLLVKTNGRIIVNPMIGLDFSKGNFLFQINMIANADEQINTDNNQEDISGYENARGFSRGSDLLPVEDRTGSYQEAQ